MSELTEQEKQKIKELLDELNEIKGMGTELENWNIKAHIFIVFTMAKYPSMLFEANR